MVAGFFVTCQHNYLRTFMCTDELEALLKQCYDWNMLEMNEQLEYAE